MTMNPTPGDRDYPVRRDRNNSGWLWGTLAAIAVIIVIGLLLWGAWDTEPVEAPGPVVGPAGPVETPPPPVVAEPPGEAVPAGGVVAPE